MKLVELPDFWIATEKLADGAQLYSTVGLTLSLNYSTGTDLLPCGKESTTARELQGPGLAKRILLEEGV